MPLDGPAQRTGPVYRIVALFCQPRLGFVADVELDAAFGQPSLHLAHKQVDDALQVLFGQRAKYDDVVDPIQQFRAEGPLQCGLDGSPHLLHTVSPFAKKAYALTMEFLCTEVTGHDDHGVPEVHGPAVSVGEPSVLQQLQ